MTEDTHMSAQGGLVGPAVFPGIRPETRDALERLCRKRAFAAGQTVIAESTASEFVGTVHAGVLRMQKTFADGRQHVVGLLVEGDMFGRVFDGATEFSIEAATDAEICAFDRTPFEKLLMQAPDLDRSVLLNILNELDRARDWMLILSNHKISNRLAGFLILMCSRFAAVDHLVERRDAGIQVTVPISRTDLAHLLGTRPESLSRAFHWLQDQRDIAILEPNLILLRDLASLAKRAGEDDIEVVPRLRDLLDKIPAWR